MGFRWSEVQILSPRPTKLKAPFVGAFLFGECARIPGPLACRPEGVRRGKAMLSLCPPHPLAPTNKTKGLLPWVSLFCASRYVRVNCRGDTLPTVALDFRGNASPGGSRVPRAPRSRMRHSGPGRRPVDATARRHAVRFLHGGEAVTSCGFNPGELQRKARTGASTNAYRFF